MEIQRVFKDTFQRVPAKCHNPKNIHPMVEASNKVGTRFHLEIKSHIEAQRSIKSLVGALKNMFDKVLVVDVAMLVLKGRDEVLHVHLLHLFPESRQEMAEFRRGYRSVGVFVEHPAMERDLLSTVIEDDDRMGPWKGPNKAAL